MSAEELEGVEGAEEEYPPEEQDADSLAETEEGEEEAEETAGAAEEQVPEVDERLIDAALRHGFGAEDIQALGANAKLVLEKLAASPARATEPAVAPMAQAREGAPAATGAGAARGEGTYRPFVFDLAELKETLGEDFEGRVTHPIEQKFGQYEAMFGHLLQELQRIQSASAAQTLDRFVEGLGEDYQHVYGKGPLDELGAQSPERAARESLYRTALALMDAQGRLGEPISLRAALAKANALQSPDKLAQGIRAGIREALQKGSKQMIARPTGTPRSLGPEQDRTKEAAIEAAADLLNQLP